MNKGVDVEHGRNHLITSQCGKPLTDAREPINNENGPQDTLVHPNECE